MLKREGQRLRQKADIVFTAELGISIVCAAYLVKGAFTNGTRESIVMLVCALGFSLCVSSVIWQIRSRYNFKNDLERDALLLAVNTAYPIQIMADLSEDSYEYLPTAKFVTYNVPRTGVYSELVKNGLSRVKSEDRERYCKYLSRAYLLEAFASGASDVRVEYRDKDVDGEYRWIAMHAYKIESKRDKNVRVIFIARANDEQKKTEAFLERSLELKKRELSDVYSALSIGIVKVKKEDGYPLLTANDAFFEMIGYTKEQFAAECGGLIRCITFEGDGKGFDDILPGERSAGRYRIVRRDGTLFWARYDAMLMPEEGNVYYIMYTDITEAVKAEQELSQHRYYSEMANRSTPAVTIIFSSVKFSTEPLYIRGDTVGMCGYTTDEVIQMGKRGFYGLLYEDDMEAVFGFVRHFIANHPELMQTEFRVRCKNGKIAWLMLQANLTTDYYGDPACICMVVDITAQKERENEALMQYNIDQMTGVLNRNAFIESVANAFKNTSANQKHAFIMLDIDDFKSINDRFGHAAGDTVLRRVSAILCSVLRKEDFVGRLGGDEFMIMLRNVSEERALHQRCKEICRRVSELTVGDLRVSVSLGVASYPRDARNFEAIYLCADAAMYEAKRRGKNGYCIYSPDMQNIADL